MFFSFLNNNSFILVNKENQVFDFSSFGFVRLKIIRNVLNIKVPRIPKSYIHFNLFIDVIINLKQG